MTTSPTADADKALLDALEHELDHHDRKLLAGLEGLGYHFLRPLRRETRGFHLFELGYLQRRGAVFRSFANGNQEHAWQYKITEEGRRVLAALRQAGLIEEKKP